MQPTAQAVGGALGICESPEGPKEKLQHHSPTLDHHDNFYDCRGTETRTACTTRVPISAVEITACVFPARSAVRAPCESTADTASSTDAASFSNWNECRNNIATVKIAPNGFAIPFPAMSGADPCTGSYNPTAPPTLADASSPSEPTTPPAWSDKMSPNIFSVSSTSTSVGRCTTSMAAESTY